MYPDENMRISAVLAHVGGLSEEQISTLSVEQLSEICGQLGFLAEECDQALADLSREGETPRGSLQAELGKE